VIAFYVFFGRKLLTSFTDDTNAENAQAQSAQIPMTNRIPAKKKNLQLAKCFNKQMSDSTKEISNIYT